MNFKLLDRNSSDINEHHSTEINSPIRTGRRRKHLTTINRNPDFTIPEEEQPICSQQLNEKQNNSSQQNQSSHQIKKHCCCCHTSEVLFCTRDHYQRLPDIIIQHQPTIIMSADIKYDQNQSINQIDNSTSSELAFVYTPSCILENDVFLPAGNQSFTYGDNMTNYITSMNTNLNNQVNNQVNNQAINQVNNLLNYKANQQSQTKQQNQLNKMEIYSPRIIRCQLANSALYQYNRHLNAKIMLNNARRSASVSLPIDQETLRQVGYSLRMISEKFHLQRLQANAQMAKNQQTKNVSHMIKWFCKFIVNKLPSISWKATNDVNTNDKKESKLINTKISPVKRKIITKVGQMNNNQLSNNRSINQSNKLNNHLDQPDIIPMVHLIVPVRQRCHSTTDC